MDPQNQTPAPAPAAPTPEPAPMPQPPAAPTAPAAPVTATPAAMDAVQEGTAGNAFDQNQKRVLLVEDDEGLATVYLARLRAEGFDMKHVANGEDALSNAIEFKPDLILLDVMMPKISGFDVLDILRNTPETANVHIIMLTALSQDKDKERAQQLGVDDYLVKSQVVIADVVERVKHHLHI